jgi:hypothetical protein
MEKGAREPRLSRWDEASTGIWRPRFRESKATFVIDEELVLPDETPHDGLTRPAGGGERIASDAVPSVQAIVDR